MAAAATAAVFASRMGFEDAVYWTSLSSAEMVERSTAVVATKASSASSMGFEGAAYWMDVEDETSCAAISPIKITQADQARQVDNNTHLTCAIRARTDERAAAGVFVCWCCFCYFLMC